MPLSVMPLFIDIPSMSDSYNLNGLSAIVNPINNTVVTNTNAIKIRPSYKFFDSLRTRDRPQTVDGSANPLLNVWGELTKLFSS